MARPASQRRIPTRLSGGVFKPQGIPLTELDRVEMTLDGLEAICLADREGLYQEEAAHRIGVSRPTFARILAVARRAVAEALVEGKVLVVSGGAVISRPEKDWPCPVHGRGRWRGRGCHCGRGHAPEPTGDGTRRRRRGQGG